MHICYICMAKYMKRILIESFALGVNVCVVENGELTEFLIEKESNKKIVGNIYKGKVVNVLRGMQAAFVNIGLPRNAYLYAGDTLVDGSMLSREELFSSTALSLREGDQIMCQIVKDEFGAKGARITMNISLPGRVLVLMPNTDYIGISKKILDENIRDELMKLIQDNREEGFGFIIRTEAQNACRDEILFELCFLQKLYKQICEDCKRKPCFSLLHKEDNLVKRVMRDIYSSDVDEIIVNDELILEQIKEFFPYIKNNNNNFIKFENPKQSLLVKYGVSDQILRILDTNVSLANGGFLVIERTEALTVIDVNTGKYVGDKNLEETVFNTNKMAAKEVAKQIKLRNIGGIIIVDFIDMENEENRVKLLDYLQTELKKDRVNSTVVEMTQLGLVEITRKKARADISSTLLQHCPHCSGSGYTYSDGFVMQMFRNDLIKYVIDHHDANAFLVKINNAIANKIFSNRFFEKEFSNALKEKIIYLIPEDKRSTINYEIFSERSVILDLPDNARLLY